MSAGLLALVDDLTALAKLVASSVDDAAAQGSKAIGKASGIVIDDAAVTPRYVIGYAADRELPIIAKIAKGSLINKLVILTPVCLLLNNLAPWLLTPLLMLGGLYLAFEGYVKVMEMVRGKKDASPASSGGEAVAPAAADSEKAKVAGAVRTDFILSAEIMAITLSTVATAPLVTQVVVLVLVGIGMTVLVYGTVSLIVKADDFGAYLAQTGSGVARAVGRGIVSGMPKLLATLGFVGMLAMLWVGGGIITHGLHELGVHGPEDFVKHIGALAGGAVPVAAGAVSWIVTAAVSAVIGVVLGAIVSPVAHKVLPAH
jgi:predicted DNA repair protein MutK